MKRIITICAAVLMTASMFAQSPEKMSYQAVVRDGSDALITSTAVGMQISILQSTANGNAVYVETQTPTANANGLVSLEIGTGTVVSGDFSTIDWANGPYFIKTETDPSGGTNYSITGTSQLMSVPYALYAKTSENGITAEQTTAIETNTAKVGYTEALVSANTAVVANSAKVGVKNGSTAGEMQYWDGTDWISVEVGTTGQILTYIGGKPMWVDKDAMVDQESGQIWKDITSSTGQIWMDRNLGASQVAGSSTDADAYGDLYQWGRAADGHQLRTSDQTSTLSTTDTPGHGDFIINSPSPYDWRSRQNANNLWQGVDGVNNPCPSGYRLPTEAEWGAELGTGKITNAQSAFEILKLPMAGNRSRSNGSLHDVGTLADNWSSSVRNSNSLRLFFSSRGASMGGVNRASGRSVRCIKD